MLELSCFGKHREANFPSLGGGQFLWLFLFTRWSVKGKFTLQAHLYNRLQEEKRKSSSIINLYDVLAGRDRD